MISEDKLTSVGVINEFFKALTNGNAEKLNEQYTQNHFENSRYKNGYSEFSAQKISDIKVKLLDKSIEDGRLKT